jgi:anaerobic dimethyl sulfoxide reductase subunit B (iron-sulfur subunit)/Tat-targeted selenate reductase subunit YnfG
MSQYGFYFDNTRCTGCRTCELACKDYKDLDADHTFRRVIDYEGGTWTAVDEYSYTQNSYSHHISIACNHCEDPICVHVCPTGAMHKDDNNLVWPDANKCIGCGYCVKSCPYHAPFIDELLKASSKCDGCTARVSQDKKPICVEACPLRALDFGQISELKSTYPGGVSSILPLPNADYTQPNLWINASDAALLSNEVAGSIANFSEIK